MPTELKRLEEQLLDNIGLRELEFEAALKLTESLPACLDAGDFGQTTLADLNSVLQGVATLEQRGAEIHSEWKSQGGKPGPDLTTRIQRVGKQIEELMSRFAMAEGIASAARERLKPQISHEVNCRRMLSSYGT